MASSAYGPQDAGEVLAFIERGTSAAAVFRKLTGQEPGRLAAVCGASGVAGLSVALEQTLSCSGGSSIRQGPRPPPSGASTRASGSSGGAWGAYGAGAKAKASAPSPPPAVAVVADTPAPAKALDAIPVVDSWEDM